MRSTPAELLLRRMITASPDQTRVLRRLTLPELNRAAAVFEAAANLVTKEAWRRQAPPPEPKGEP